MKQLAQWLTWRFEPNPGKAKLKKVPFDHKTGHRTSPTDPTTWMTHAEAVATGERIGFVFTAEDPYFFFDLDNCREGDGWNPAAIALVARFPGAEVEASVSGTGLHIFGRYTGPRPAHGCNSGGWLELYTADRFAAIGQGQTGDCETDCTEALAGLIISHFPQVFETASSEWTTEPVPEWTGPTDDAELIRKALRTKSPAVMFGKTCAFDSLWAGDEAALSVHFPDAEREYDASSADLALAKHLSYWTGGNCERIERLMRESGLNREKYDREDYMQRTILNATSGELKVYDRIVEAEAEGVAPQQFQFMTVQGQAELFKGCIYVISSNRVMTPEGRLLNKEQFNASMPSYEFARDTSGKGTTRKPWEAFNERLGETQPQAVETCFDPLVGWAEPIERGGLTYANTYRPIETPRKQGDASPFLDHLSRMLPDTRDSAILLAYMAAVIQHKGVKFYWAPVIQGVEGNGKSMIACILQQALGAHFGMASGTDLGNKFNGWIVDRILIGIEDARISEAAFDTLKPMITNPNIPVQPKGQEQRMVKSCANFMFSTNHRDGIPKSGNDRRFAVFFTAQQERAHLAGDMAPEKIAAVYDWLDGGGYAIVHEYLATYAIPDELNPATKCRRAPDTSTIDQVIASSLGATEQQVMDWADEGRPGFGRPWISRTILSQVLQDRISPNRQRDVLHRLGYVPHPATVSPGRPYGRTNSVVRPDGCKAELWVLSDHLAAQLPSNIAASSAYETAQIQEQTHGKENEYQNG